MRRREIGLSQADLAMASGTGLRFIGELERGKESVELGKALTVLANLGLSLTLAPKGGR